VCRPYHRRSGALMPNFIFEIIRAGDDPQVVGELSLPDFAAAWCNVETLAFKLRKTESEAFIRVKDSKGRIVAFAGICTALALARSRRFVCSTARATCISCRTGPPYRARG
jgi:hypothetical protein